MLAGAELDALVGSIVELGRLTRTPTPTIEAVYALTKLLTRPADGASGVTMSLPAASTVAAAIG